MTKEMLQHYTKMKTDLGIEEALEPEPEDEQDAYICK